MPGFCKSMKIDACYYYKRVEILDHTFVVISCQVRKKKKTTPQESHEVRLTLFLILL